MNRAEFACRYLKGVTVAEPYFCRNASEVFRNHEAATKYIYSVALAMPTSIARKLASR